MNDEIDFPSDSVIVQSLTDDKSYVSPSATHCQCLWLIRGIRN